MADAGLGRADQRQRRHRAADDLDGGHADGEQGRGRTNFRHGFQTHFLSP
ncbi:hypothetical protein [Mesorhizobium sp.]|nr:hypothetical protein [Mesorhizobium sp.]